MFLFVDSRRERDFRLFYNQLREMTRVPDFSFHVSPRIWVGPDALLRLPPPRRRALGRRPPRCMLVVDPLLYESKTVDRVHSLLEERGIQVLIYDEIVDRATSKAVDDALRLARGSRSPLIIALGGLKTLMIGRATAALALGNLDIDAALDGAENRGPRFQRCRLSCKNEAGRNRLRPLRRCVWLELPLRPAPGRVRAAQQSHARPHL